MTGPDASYRINPDLAWRTIDGEVVILKVKSTTYYSLDAVGSFLWGCLDSGFGTRKVLVEKVVGEFEVDPATAERDLGELLEDLVREELVLAA